MCVAIGHRLRMGAAVRLSRPAGPGSGALVRDLMLAVVPGYPAAAKIRGSPAADVVSKTFPRTGDVPSGGPVTPAQSCRRPVPVQNLTAMGRLMPQTHPGGHTRVREADRPTPRRR